MNKIMLRRNDLVYPDLCYQIIGILFNVGIEVGFGHKESFYQKAVVKGLENNGLNFKEQLPVKLFYKDKFIGIYYFDFLIEDKIVLEIKTKTYFSKKDIEQLYSYLKAKGLKLGILAHFTPSGVKFKRIVNIE